MHSSNVEIFKTDVSSKLISEIIISKLNKSFPDYIMNFDLDDCDKILRVESTNESIDIHKILGLLEANKINIELITE